MTSWRDSASAQARSDLDDLLNAVLPFAQNQLETRGQFFPFGATVSTEGELSMTAADPGAARQPASQAMLDALYAGVRAASASTRAAAFVTDVKAGGGDAIRVELEHVDGATMTILMPYSRRRRKDFTYGTLQAGSSEGHVW